MYTKNWNPQQPRFWIGLVYLVVFLLFLYFYEPFNQYLTQAVTNVHFDNVIIWFVSVIAVCGFALSHWQSFQKHIFRKEGEPDIKGLVFDTLQTILLTGIIIFSGSALQEILIISRHLLSGNGVLTAEFGNKMLGLLALALLTILFFLLHMAVRVFRRGIKSQRWEPPKKHLA